MSSFKNAIPKPAHKERAQPFSRKKFGLLEKHKDYVVRANAYHQKQETLQKLKEKASFKNPDEFYFKMTRTKMVNGVHRPESEAKKYSPEEIMLMKTQDMGCVLQTIQNEKKKIEKLTVALHLVASNQSSHIHIYFAEDRQEAKEIKSRIERSKSKIPVASNDMPDENQRKATSLHKELEESRNKVSKLQEIYNDMAMQKELQKKGHKRKLRADEIVVPTSKPVYKWRAERKR